MSGENIGDMRDRFTRHTHNLAVLISDTDKDQPTVQVSHRCGALSDRRSAPATP